MPIRSVASGILQSKDGTHIEVAALTAPVTAHATIGAHVPESCVAVRGLRRRPKQGTAASLVKAAAVAGAKSRSLCRKPSYPAALVGLHGRSVPFAHRRGTVPAAPCLQCLALGRVRPPKRNVGDRTAVAICRVDFTSACAPALADAASTATCLPPFYVSLAVARVVRSTAAASITDIRPQETALPAHHPPGRHCTSRTDSPQAA